MMAFIFNCCARSKMASNSAFCSATGSPGLEGQTPLPTVDTQAPRNSRCGFGGPLSGDTPVEAAPSACPDAHNPMRTASALTKHDCALKFICDEIPVLRCLFNSESRSYMNVFANSAYTKA